MREDIENMPVYRKAMEILKITHQITQLVNDQDDKMLQSTAEFMREDALQIPAKIAGAEGGDLYDLRMENAAIIRKCARNIYVSCNTFLATDFKEVEYLTLLRKEIDEFRLLFAQWVQSFDQWNYVIDRWGLFNPPGVKYDDKDPDDDLPFENPLK